MFLSFIKPLIPISFQYACLIDFFILQKGQLWPNKTTEIVIKFAPKQIGDLDALVYLDIDGVGDRVMLKLTGTALPPNIHLNLETLDMSSVYINILYNYEIIAINKGSFSKSY